MTTQDITETEEAALRTGLESLANNEPTPDPIQPITAILTRGKQRRRKTRIRTWSALAAGTVAAAAMGISAQHLLSTNKDEAPTTPPSVFDTWPTRGDRATDTAFIHKAISEWDAASGHEHFHIHALYAADAFADPATKGTIHRRTVVLTGYTKDGRLRGAWLDQPVADADPAKAYFLLRDDRPLPETDAVQIDTKVLDAVAFQAKMPGISPPPPPKTSGNEVTAIVVQAPAPWYTLALAAPGDLVQTDQQGAGRVTGIAIIPATEFQETGTDSGNVSVMIQRERDNAWLPETIQFADR